VAPKKQPIIEDCIILKAFINQIECLKQLKNADDIKRIEGATFSFPRALVYLDDDEVNF
jgi:hypothetical protein